MSTCTLQELRAQMQNRIKDEEENLKIKEDQIAAMREDQVCDCVGVLGGWIPSLVSRGPWGVCVCVEGGGLGEGAQRTGPLSSQPLKTPTIIPGVSIVSFVFALNTWQMMIVLAPRRRADSTSACAILWNFGGPDDLRVRGGGGGGGGHGWSGGGGVLLQAAYSKTVVRTSPQIVCQIASWQRQNNGCKKESHSEDQFY